MLSVAFTVGFTAVNAQRAAFTKSINTRGWNVPRADRAESVTDIIEIDGVSVAQTRFVLSSPKPFIKINREICEFSSLVSYAIAGETFAVRGECVKVGKWRGGGKAYYGGLGTFTYYDENGDGTFESRYSSGFMEITIPARLKVKHGPPPLPVRPK